MKSLKSSQINKIKEIGEMNIKLITTMSRIKEINLHQSNHNESKQSK